MTTTPLPLTAPPHLMVRQPRPRPGEDHQTHLSGGARYAICDRSRNPAGRLSGLEIDRARSQREAQTEGRR